MSFASSYESVGNDNLDVIVEEISWRLTDLLQMATGISLNNQEASGEQYRTGTYEVLSAEKSQEVRGAGHNILRSRFVLVQTRIEPDDIPAIKDEGLLEKMNMVGSKQKQDMR